MEHRVTDLIPARPFVVVAQYLDLRLLEGPVRGAVVGPGLAEEEPTPLRRDDAHVRERLELDGELGHLDGRDGARRA